MLNHLFLHYSNQFQRVEKFEIWKAPLFSFAHFLLSSISLTSSNYSKTYTMTLWTNHVANQTQNREIHSFLMGWKHDRSLVILKIWMVLQVNSRTYQSICENNFKPTHSLLEAIYFLSWSSSILWPSLATYSFENPGYTIWSCWSQNHWMSSCE